MEKPDGRLLKSTLIQLLSKKSAYNLCTDYADISCVMIHCPECPFFSEENKEALLEELLKENSE